jgi:orotate phosphoribosyltransferase
VNLNTKFIEFLFEANIIKFGNFLTKSGRSAPIFFNFGEVNNGSTLKKLAEFYHHEIIQFFPTCNLLFGPAYKGIPLCVATSIVSSGTTDYSFSFDRKEEKSHGDKGIFVGRTPKRNDKVVIVEDAVTAGTTLRSLIPKLRTIEGLQILGVVVAVDREEKVEITDAVNAKHRLEEELQTKIISLTTLSQIINFAKNHQNGNSLITTEQHRAIDEYLKMYSALYSQCAIK